MAERVKSSDFDIEPQKKPYIITIHLNPLKSLHCYKKKTLQKAITKDENITIQNRLTGWRFDRYARVHSVFSEGRRPLADRPNFLLEPREFWRYARVHSGQRRS